MALGMKGFVPLYVEVPKETMREINRRMRKCGMKKWEIVKWAVHQAPFPIYGPGAKGSDLVPRWGSVK